MTLLTRSEVRPNGRSTDALGYFPAVDGLRALAVLIVMAFHLNEDVLPGGYVGVDIFFVISGFVVTASIAHKRFDTLPAMLTYFYSRRVTRILPALLVTLIATAIAYCLFVPTAWLSSTIQDTGKWAFLGASNIIMAGSDNYFSPKAAFNPFTHTWSLGVEEQFYFVFPFLMFFGQRKDGSRAPWLVPLILALCAVSLAASAFLTTRNWGQAFYLLPARFWELGLGMALCLTMPRWRPLLEKAARTATLLTITGVAAIVVAIAIPTDITFPFPWALLPVFAAVALIASAVARPQGVFINALSWSPIVFIGKISYALYLWHWPIDSLMRWTIGLNSWTTWAIATLSAFFLAMPTYYFIEQPARHWRKRTILRPSLIVGVGLVAAIGLGFVTTKAVRNKDTFSLSSTRNVALWYPTTLAPTRAGCVVLDETHKDGPANVRTFTPRGCGAPSTAGILFAAGDSHATAYTRMLHAYAGESGRTVRLYTIPGCPIVGLIPEAPDTDCTRAQSVVVQQIGTLAGPNDVIFLPSLRTPRYVDQSGGTRVSKDVIRWAEEASHWPQDGTPAPLIAALKIGGARIVFEGPKPVFKAPPFRCGDWFNRTNPECEGGLSIAKTELEARRAPALALMRTLAADDRRITIWDPFAILCPGDRCEAFADGKPLFFDGDHISANGNDVLLPHFRAAIEATFAGLPPS